MGEYDAIHSHVRKIRASIKAMPAKMTLHTRRRPALIGAEDKKVLVGMLPFRNQSLQNSSKQLHPIPGWHCVHVARGSGCRLSHMLMKARTLFWRLIRTEQVRHHCLLPQTHQTPVPPPYLQH
ncbi:unnamed protein product [Ectocarpus sp. 12 AP-2014]